MPGFLKALSFIPTGLVSSNHNGLLWIPAFPHFTAKSAKHFSFFSLLCHSPTFTSCLFCSNDEDVKGCLAPLPTTSKLISLTRPSSLWEHFFPPFFCFNCRSGVSKLRSSAPPHVHTPRWSIVHAHYLSVNKGSQRIHATLFSLLGVILCGTFPVSSERRRRKIMGAVSSRRLTAEELRNV